MTAFYIVIKINAERLVDAVGAAEDVARYMTDVCGMWEPISVDIQPVEQ